MLFLPLSQAAREYPDLVRDRLFTEVRPDRDRLTALHAALFSGGTFLYVPEGVVIEQPLVSQFWSATGGAAVLPHTLIVAGRGSQFNYVDEFLSPGPGAGRLHLGARRRSSPARAATWATSRSNAGVAMPGSSPTSGRGSTATRRSG